MAVPSMTVEERPNLIRWGHLRYVAAAFAVLTAAILLGNVFFLNFVHVMCGVMWTGIDVFVGFVLGPSLRQVNLPARRALSMKLLPRMLFLMPSLAIITGTAGYFLAKTLGFLDVSYPDKLWVDAALVIIAILTVQGLCVLLPINLLTCLELQKEQPDLDKLGRRMRIYVRQTALQASLQIAIIVVMARFATGL
ncbi:MAG: hypothetical protein ABSC26_03095 [Stellaceae bacterium]|jgi:uncharacterized membrane protein